MKIIASLFLLTSAAAVATSIGTCSVSISGSVNQTVNGTNECSINPVPDIFVTANNASDLVQLNLFINPFGGITAASTQSTLFQDLEVAQVITGGTGNAILKINYRHYYHFSYGAINWQQATYSNPDPQFTFNGNPIASGPKEDFSGGGAYACSFCYLIVYPVEMPITFGVPFSRGWNHNFSAQYAFDGDAPFDFQFTWSGGLYDDAAVTHNPDYRPFMQVFVDGQPVPFQVQDVAAVPELSSGAMLLTSLSLLALGRRIFQR